VLGLNLNYGINIFYTTAAINTRRQYERNQQTINRLDWQMLTDKALQPHKRHLQNRSGALTKLVTVYVYVLEKSTVLRLRLNRSVSVIW